MKKKLSIGLRLSLWYLLIFACAQGVFGLGMWLILRHNLYDITDDALEAQIADVSNFLASHDSAALRADLHEELTKTYALEHSADYLQIQDDQGNWIYRSSFLQDNGLPPIDAARLKRPLYEDRSVGGMSFRFLSEGVDVGGHRYILQIGSEDSDVLQTLLLFQRYLLLFAPLLLLAASGGGYWLSLRALSPVDVLTQTARNISGANLSDRLERLDTGDELQRLSDTLNEMLSRIEAAFLRVSQFTADASHELRTPIALIRTEAEIALRKARGEAEYRETLGHILSEAEQTSALIESLLSFARADAGRETLEMQKINLREIIQQAARDWSPAIGAQNLQFTENISRVDLFVTGDKNALARLAGILLDNAIKYTPAPGTIDLTLEENNQKAILAIRDSGIGISPEDQAKIFERFYRVDKARTRALGGSGLGLAIAKWIVEHHSGRIIVTSSPGAGSIFVVELPLQRVGDSAASELRSVALLR
jgi:heavy metal sensor kinase